MTQRERILRHLREAGSITRAEAMRMLAVGNLPSRISEMRKDGIPIVGETVEDKNIFGEKISYTRYRLEA